MKIKEYWVRPKNRHLEDVTDSIPDVIDRVYLADEVDERDNKLKDALLEGTEYNWDSEMNKEIWAIPSDKLLKIISKFLEKPAKFSEISINTPKRVSREGLPNSLNNHIVSEDAKGKCPKEWYKTMFCLSCQKRTHCPYLVKKARRKKESE